MRTQILHFSGIQGNDTKKTFLTRFFYAFKAQLISMLSQGQGFLEEFLLLKFSSGYAACSKNH